MVAVTVALGANHGGWFAHTGSHHFITFYHVRRTNYTTTHMSDRLDEILTAFEEALDCWNLALSGNAEGLKSILPATVQDPLKELIKIIKLVRAHTTKVGIIFEPTKLASQSDAAYTTASDLSKAFVLFMSILAQLEPEKISTLFYKEILSVSYMLIVSATSLVAELKKLKTDTTDESSSHTQNDSSGTNVRLVSVGKVWSVCDELAKLVENGNLKFLEKKTRVQLSLLEDGLDEFAEWAENPEDFDLDDPFGLDEFSDEDDGECEVPSVSDLDSDNDEKSDDFAKGREELAAYAKQWVQKFKLVKLLFLSINKSLPTIIKGSDIDDIYKTESIICKESDMLIVELMMNHSVLEDVEKHANLIDKACSKILSIVKKANKNNDNKTKWCGSWESKYKEILDTMYN